MNEDTDTVCINNEYNLLLILTVLVEWTTMVTMYLYVAMKRFRSIICDTDWPTGRLSIRPSGQDIVVTTKEKLGTQ